MHFTGNIFRAAVSGQQYCDHKQIVSSKIELCVNLQNSAQFLHICDQNKTKNKHYTKNIFP